VWAGFWGAGGNYLLSSSMTWSMACRVEVRHVSWELKKIFVLKQSVSGPEILSLPCLNILHFWPQKRVYLFQLAKDDHIIELSLTSSMVLVSNYIYHPVVDPLSCLLSLLRLPFFVRFSRYW
jgi:hypothetical protein